MESADLRAFAAFASTLNFTHAARTVHLSQPALFAVVKRLSASLSTPLYERHGRALALTSAGQRLAAHARDVLDAERDLRASLHCADESAPVVLASGEGALVHVVSGAVASFARAHPRRLRIVIADGPSAVQLVVRGAAHVAVVAGAITVADDARDDIVLRSLIRSRVVAVARGAAGAPAVSIPELATHDLVLPPRGRPMRESIEEAFATHDLTPRVVAEASGWSAALMLAQMGVGTALVNDVVALPRGVAGRAVEGLAPVIYRCVARKNRTALATDLWRALA